MPPVGNKSIRDFFKPSQPAPKPATLPASSSQPPSNFKNLPLAARPAIATKLARSQPAMGQAKSIVSSASAQAGSSAISSAPDPAKSLEAPNTHEQRDYTSGLSPPPTTEPSSSSVSPPPASEPTSSTLPQPKSKPTLPASEQPLGSVSPPKEENVPFPAVSSNVSSERVIQDSDDESDGSESSLEDLSALLAAKNSEVRAKQATNGITPSTPVASRHSAKTFNFHVSPLPVLSKHKFDLKSLVSRAEDHEATEASSKRVKAMMAARDSDEDTTMSDHAAELAKFPHGALLGSVVAEREDLEAHKVTRAIMRTEATVTEKRWYFFNTNSSAPKPQRTPFPTEAVSENWKTELVDPNTRYHSFVSGYAEDMVTIGKKLPDELFLWMLDEACLEASDPLRKSYLSIITVSNEQITRLLTPDLVRKVFQSLGGSPNGTDITQKVVPVPKLADPYGSGDWARLLSLINFFGHISKFLQIKTRTSIICMLLRMSVDHVVYENVDLLDSVQITISRLCRSTPEKEWDACVRVSSPLARK